MSSTKTTIGNYEFENCLMNAAGVYCYGRNELEQIINSDAGTFVTKSTTLNPREGNPLPRYYDTKLGCINSMGLPNLGIDYYLDYLLELQKTHPNRTFFLSLTGLSSEEIHTLLNKVYESDFNGLTELNLSCPNVPGKPQMAYDFEATEKLLNKVFEYFKKPLGVKLPPYFDIVHFDEAAKVFNKFPLTFVNCINSIGNGLVINDEHVVIKPKTGIQRYRRRIYQTYSSCQCSCLLSKTESIYTDYRYRRNPHRTERFRAYPLRCRYSPNRNYSTKRRSRSILKNYL